MTQTTKTDPIDQLDALIDEREGGESLAAFPRTFPIVAAITDDKFAPAVLRMVHALVRERGASPTLVEVAKVALHTGWDATGTVGVLADDLFGPAFRMQCVHELRARYRGEHAISPDWPVEVRVGDIASCIGACVHDSRAELVVMGLHRHGKIARAVGDDTVHEVMNTSTVPVLALRPGLGGLPRRLIVAMDFSAASLRAARLARHLMDERGIMYLAHVRSGLPIDDSEQSEGMRTIEAAGIEAAFKRVVGDLAAAPGMTISCITLQGSPAEALKVLADGVQPDLVAIGSQSHRWLDRLLLGSVASAIVREGRWSALVTPPASRMHPNGTRRTAPTARRAVGPSA